jgi:hypothetical protein
VTDDTPNYATLKARDNARKSLHAHPLPDTRRVALFGALIAYMGNEGICFPGTILLAKVTRISKPTVLKILNEFAANALIEFVDLSQTGRRARRIRLHPERLSLYGLAVKPELTGKESPAVKPVLTAKEIGAVSGGYRDGENFAVKTKAVCGKARVDPSSKPREVLVPKASAQHPNVRVSLAPEKSDVPEKADCRSNDAVQKKTLMDRQRLNNINSARARRT